MKTKFMDRRKFLKGMAVTGATLGVAVTVKPAMAKESEVVNENLYRETEHFKKYYKSLRD
jgi:Ni,Fe-hydrogenase I small subunit